MTSDSLKNFYRVQICAVIGLLGCVIIRPHGLSANAGLSYFGNYRTTIVPYGVVLLGGSWFYFKASSALRDNEHELTKRVFLIFSILYLVLFCTPYTFGNIIDWAHTITGVVLFSSQLILTAWIVIRSGLDSSLAFLWLIEFMAGVLCAVYTPPPTGYLLEFQVVFQLAYAIFYIRYLSKYKEVHKLSEGLLSFRLTPR